MKRLFLAVLLATLAISAVFSWRHWHAVRPESSVIAATNSGPASSAGMLRGQANSTPLATTTGRPTGSLLAVTMPAAAAGQPPRRAWDYNYLASLSNAAPGTPIRFELEAGSFAAGTIQHAEYTNDELTYVSGVVTQPESGRFFFQKQTLPGKQGDFAGVVEFPASKTAWRIEPSGPGGKSELVKHRLDEVICLAMPPVDPALEPTNIPEEMPPLRPDQVTDYVPAYNDGIISLQSLPGATGVLYIDYRGGYTPTWGGITYAKPSAASAQIKDVWKRVAEDYMPFNINVTTDIKVYQAAPENSRQRCICTPTTTAAPGAGGVSYMNSWNWTGDTPNWSFYSTGKAAAEVVAHECGHCVGLGHQGNNTSGYDTGHAGPGTTGWAPIMGAGYYQPVTEWAKGGYLNANNTEDELNIITTQINNVAYRADDTGATLATARYLEVYASYAAFAEGVIEKTGDTDAFRFTTAGGAISLTASPVATNDWANLAIMATLADVTDTIIASNNPQSVLTASIATNLPAGTYTFRVTGAGRNDPLTNGFSNCASLGYYSVTGSVAAATLTTRFNLAENSTNGTTVGIVTATNLGVDALNYFIVSGNTSNTFALDDNGVLTVTNAATLDYETLGLNTQLAVRFEMFVNITNTVNPALTELNRRLVVVITNVNESPTLTGFTNTLIAHTLPGTVVGTVATADQDFYTVLTLSIIGGNSNAMFTVSNATGNLVVAGDLNPATQSVYNLTIQVADNGSPVLKATNYVQITVTTNTSPFRPGTLSYAVYDGIGTGILIANMTANSRFPTDATWEKQIPTAEGDTDRADGYGSVLRGYLIPPVSGNYNFFIATDDNGELWMSTTTNPASMMRIADITGSSLYAGVRQWNKFASQKSVARALVAGQAYYLEARQKEGSGGDNLAVGWSGPATDNLTNVIPGTYLAPYLLNYVPHAIGFTNTVHRAVLAGARLGQVTMTDLNTNDAHSFAITAGNTAGIFSMDTNGWVYVANDAALAASATTNFILTFRCTDNGTPALSGTNTVALNLVEANVVATTLLQREMFTNIGSGTVVSALTGSAKYPNKPDALVPLTSFASPADVADNFGSRIRGYVVPSVSGDYRFFIASDDSSQLKFSRDTNAANATVIASVTGYTSQNVWNTFSTQTSALITGLVAGQRYYIEALHKEGSGGDHVSVAWLVPGSGVTNIIPGANLQPVDLNAAPQINNLTLGLMQSVANGTTVATVTASDSPLDRLVFKFVSGNTNNTFAINPYTGVITVADNTPIASGAVANFPLAVKVQDSGYGGLYPVRSATNSVSISIVSANSLVWDAISGAIGKQDGDGSWDGTMANWWNNYYNVVWSDNLMACFGVDTTTNCTVTLISDVTPSGLVFNQTSGGVYTLAGGGGALNLSGTPTIAANADATISASIKGAGFIKTGAGTLTLSGTNVYLGTTTISNGTLLVNGVLTTNAASTVTVATNATLGGTGLINGATIVQDGGTLAPGSGGIGQLTISNDVNLSASSKSSMELSKNGGVLTNDLVLIAGTLTQGGTLIVTNTGTNAPIVGDSFHLFSAGTNAGGFTSFNLPALANGLSWTTNSLATNGTLAVVLNTYTLTYIAESNGTLSGSMTQMVNYGDGGSAVTAVPNSGYAFTNWSDGFTVNPRADANVTNNLSVTANFVLVNLAPPAITNLSMAAGQTAFTLTGTGTAGQVYVLLSATNLPPVIWTPVATNTADANGVFQFTDLETTNYIQRFYRVMTY